MVRDAVVEHDNNTVKRLLWNFKQRTRSTLSLRQNQLPLLVDARIDRVPRFLFVLHIHILFVLICVYRDETSAFWGSLSGVSIFRSTLRRRRWSNYDIIIRLWYR